MIKFRQVLLATPIVLAVILSGCSPKIVQSTYKSESHLALSEKTSSQQSRGGIIVDVKLPSENEYKKSFVRQINVKIIPMATTANMQLDADGYFDIAENVELSFYLNLTPFNVVITNNTDHILRLKDSRIVFIDKSAEDPYRGLIKSEIIQDISLLPIYQLKVSELKQKYPKAKPGYIESQVRNALVSILDNMKIINNFDNEIIPGMKSSGVVIFPVSPRSLSEGKISFVDFVSKPDAVGNPTEKVRFDYETILLTKFFKSGAPVGTSTSFKSDWMDITREEYISGSRNPDKYYYDSTQKKWISGTPPKK